MRNILIIALTGILLSCSSVEKRQTSLLVDFNGTVESPLFAFSVDTSATIVDTAYLVDGQYIFDTSEWPFGFYRLSADSAISLDIVVGDADKMLICARRNYLNESTTNSRQTSLLWQVNNLSERYNSQYSDTLTQSLRDSLYHAFRADADRIRLNCDTCLALLNLCNLSFNGKPVYDCLSDHLIFESSAYALNRLIPSSALVANFSATVNQSREMSRLIAQFAQGAPAPKFHLTGYNGINVTSDELSGMRYVFYLTTDTSSVYNNQWMLAAQKRFDNYKVVGVVPSNFTRIHNLNVYSGTIPSGEMAILSKRQPLTIYVDYDGKIISSTFPKE